MCKRSMEIISGLLRWINGLAGDLHKAEELNSTKLMNFAKLADQNLSKDIRLMKMEEINMTRKYDCRAT
jgi:hypothetical protein